MSIFRKPLFWLLFIFFASVCIIFTFKFFSKAFPIVNLDIKFNRTQAMELADKKAQEYNLGPKEFTQAASFEVDDKVKTFVELDAGGKEAFAQMLADSYYSPYQWKVRHFREFEKNETFFYFKPDGTPYGFEETLSENASGTNVNSEQALAIVQQAASKWNVNLNEYTLVEHSKETKPSGRVNHEITFERENPRIGKGYYRVNFTVSGDKLTQILHSVKIPEEFNRKYQEMRSTNNSIYSAANLAMLLIYIICCCIIGLFFFVRRDWFIWSTPIMWGLIVAFLHELVTINEMPLYWMKYKTELSMHVFILKIIVAMIYKFFVMGALYSLAFLAAENLTRRAFGNHVQLWKMWKPSVASSWTVLGLTISGYLLVPIFLGYGVLFYLITTKFLGWWTPSEALTDPNILANYVPWFSSIIRSLGAGFMEESLFRAVPLATAALIGQKFGNRRLWLVIGFILQALIFGACHANYPTQPAYSRVIELIFLSVMQGLIYLRFGLLPAIISHFAYDVVWMSLPLFVSSAAGSWINQTFVIVLTLIPLIIVLFSRLKIGSWHTLSTSYLNSGWQPSSPPKSDSISPQDIKEELLVSINKYTKPFIVGCGVIGLGVWFLTAQFAQDAVAIQINRKQATEIAQKTMQKKAVQLPSEWQALTYFNGDYNELSEEEHQHQWIWQKGGRETYMKMLGSYLKPPRWVVRFATFSPAIDLQDRAEEYYVTIDKDGTVIRFKHNLPEKKPGAQLEEAQVRMLASEGLKNNFQLDAADLKEISAVAEKKPDRKDWTFIYENKADYPLNEGHNRLSVSIAGDKVVDASRFIHVPESWDREQHNKKNLLKIFQFLSSLLIYLLFCFGIVALFRRGIKILYNKTIVIFFISLIGIYMVNIANGWPAMIARLNTSEPYFNQIFMFLSSYGFGFFIKAAIFSIILAGVGAWQKPYKAFKNSPALFGICIGLFAAGMQALSIKVGPSPEPNWACFDALGSYLPWLDVVTTNLIKYLSVTIAIMLLYIIVDYVTHYWQRNKILATGIMILCGICLNGINTLENIPFWIIWGMLIGIILMVFYVIIIRFDHAVLPFATGAYLIMHAIQQIIFNAWPTVILGNTLSICVILILATIWAYKLNIKERYS